MSNGTAVVTLDQMQQMAKSLVASKMFGLKTEAEAMSIMLIAQAEGRSPALAARDYHVIQGRPALKADAMLARFQQAGGCVEWVSYTDTKVSGKFSHSVNSPTPVLIEWTFDQATKAGLTGKDNWKNYPRQMLRARVVAEGVRTVYPAVCVGVYTPEEVQDMEDTPAKRRAKEKDVTPPAEETRTVPALDVVLTAISGMRTKPEREAAKALADQLKDAAQVAMAEQAWTQRIEELKKPHGATI